MKLPSVARLLRANVLLAGATFVTSVLLARTLDPAARGVLANVILWPIFLSHLCLCGVPLYLSREMAGRLDDAAAYYRRGYVALMIGCCLAAGAYCALLAVSRSSLIAGEGVPGVVIAMLIMPFSAWNALQVQMELGRKHVFNYTFARGSFTIVYLVLIAGLSAAVWREPGPYLLAFLVAAAVAAITTHWLIQRSLASSGAPVALAETLPQTFRAALPFGLSNGLNALASSADRLAISLFFDGATLGVYVVALALSQVQSVVNEAIAPLFFTSMAQKEHIAQTEPAWLAAKLRQSLLINAGICAGLVAAAPILLPLIYGKAYTPALPLVSLLLPAICARNMMRPYEEVLKGMNRPLGQSLAIGTITGVFLAGAAVAAWSGSVIGVAVALLVSSLAGLVVVALLVSRECKIPLARLLVPRMADIAGLAAEMRRVIGG